MLRTWLQEYPDNGVRDLLRKKKSIRGPVAGFVVG
jgi:hypothetical protein